MILANPAYPVPKVNSGPGAAGQACDGGVGFDQDRADIVTARMVGQDPYHVAALPRAEADQADRSPGARSIACDRW
jgi:hypothetical protein